MFLKVTDTALPGVKIIEPKVFGDPRGFFKETFNAARYAEVGIPGNALQFVQDNHSRSGRGVLRGLHFQVKRPQGKLVSVSTGMVFDVAADVNPASPHFGQWVSAILSEENHLQMWIPPGYAHGFCVLSDVADFQYKCTDFYDPNDEGGVVWNDATLNIAWPIESPMVSIKDQNLPTLEQASDRSIQR